MRFLDVTLNSTLIFIANFVHLQDPMALHVGHQSVEEESDIAREEEVVQVVQAWEEDGIQ